MPSHVYSPVNVWLWISWPTLTWRSWERERMELPLRDSLNLQWSHLTNSIRTRSTSFLPTQWNLTGTLHEEAAGMRRHRKWLVMYWGTPLIRTPISEDTFCCLKCHVYWNGHLTNQVPHMCLYYGLEKFIFLSQNPLSTGLAICWSGRPGSTEGHNSQTGCRAWETQETGIHMHCTFIVCVSFSFYLGKETHSSS